MRSSFGTNVSAILAGGAQRPAVVLLHGFPSSAHTFRDVIPVLARSSYVIAPDLPGYGQSEMLPATSFDAYTTVISELLDHLGAGPRFIYLHDYGAPVGLRMAMNAPDLVLGLIIQNANAHRTGFGPEWKDTLEFWDHPSPQNKAAATAHLTLEGVRAQYTAGVPADVAKRISPAIWEEDWRVMSLPGHLEVQRSLIADYANHVAQFGAIADYLRVHQPPALMLWGRHDAFFNIAETISWMEDLPRMEAHIFDAGHFLLETHAAPAATLLRDFVESVQPQ
ncbi:alpha/beta fold hydrolase [Allorhizocola rhizosphaerae]|uniref:alpha/beta fold hydrolase n=1 Tax=Allorhizocola rhizosphaerae TaxID=1872709 RepID=UPI001B8AFF5F|nr:alpha/beta hydrolase [Allorhizocola rhizosphaerae]